MLLTNNKIEVILCNPWIIEKVLVKGKLIIIYQWSVILTHLTERQLVHLTSLLHIILPGDLFMVTFPMF